MSDIFEHVNSLSEAEISARLGLKPAKKYGGYVCPVCGHGKGGDGMRYKDGRWECYGVCGRSYNNVDLLGAVWNCLYDKRELARKLREEFGDGADKTFLFSREKNSVSAVKTANETKKFSADVKPLPPRDFSKSYDSWRRNYSLKEFLNRHGGRWRGLTFETLNEAGCLYHAEYTIGEGIQKPVIIIPYDNQLYFWRAIEGDERGIPRGGRRRPYVASPIRNNGFAPNFIVEGEIDALSIRQEIRGNGSCKTFGVMASGGTTQTNSVVMWLNQRYGSAAVKPMFIILPDNDGYEKNYAGKKFGDTLRDRLIAEGYPAVCNDECFLSRHFGIDLEGNYTYVNSSGEVEHVYCPKFDANDALQRGDGKLENALNNILDFVYEDLLTLSDKIQTRKRLRV